MRYHYVREPVRFWSHDGPDEGVLRALAERQFGDLPRQAPSPQARREQLAAELEAALRHLRTVHASYWDRDSTASNGHHVVTDGPYRYVRHTSYSGIALVLAGIALACDDMWSLVAVAVLGGAGLAVRIRAEERQLCEALGDEYQHFAAGRKRLMPGVW